MPVPRIAFFSPFNPVRSGVSDYSEELLPELGRHAQVTLVADYYSLDNQELVRQFSVLNVEQFRSQASKFTMPVYQVANSLAHHGYMIPCIEEFPGVMVLHDYFLHHLMLGLTLLRGDFRAVVEILCPAHEKNASSLAWGLLASTADPYGISLISPLLDRARVIVTHSNIARDFVLAERPEAQVRVIPMAMPTIDSARRSDIRRELGISEQDFVLASVSTLSYTKRIEVVIDSLAELQSRRPQLQLWILGGGQISRRAMDRIESAGLQNRVRIVGWTPAAKYEQLLVAADAVIDLRYPSGAETSASLLRAIGAGKPAIVSAQGSFLELPDNFTCKIRVEAGETAQIAAVLEDLIDHPSKTAAMGEAARAHALGQMRLDQAAEGYLEAIELAQSCSPVSNPARWQSTAGRTEKMLFAALYKAGRAAFLFRTYGFSQALNRLRDTSSGSGRR